MPIILAYAEPPAAVAPASPKPSVITQPDWQSRPTGADLAALYPKAAAAAHIEGRAVLRCKVAASGDLTDCTANAEQPPGQGFADAALAMAPKFKMKPMSKDGVAVAGGQVAIPIRFGLPKAAPLNLETALECYGATAVGKVMLTNGESADLGWRDAAMALAAAEHVSASGVDASLIAAREVAETPASREDAAATLQHCREIRNSGAVQALRPKAAPAG
jgi:TonB family protein